MERIDLNCDLGESFGAYTIGMDSEVLPYITSANIACGFHGGDPLVMERTVAACARAGAGVGAHPGFPDLIGFGRRNMAATPDEVRTYIAYQTGALLAFCHEQGVRMTHVKPHGALYNMAAKDYALAKAVGWNAKVILSVPCCQHELNMQFSDSVRHDNGKGGENRGMVYEMLAPVMDYGLLRERFAALVTDGLRAPPGADHTAAKTA